MYFLPYGLKIVYMKNIIPKLKTLACSVSYEKNISLKFMQNKNWNVYKDINIKRIIYYKVSRIIYPGKHIRYQHTNFYFKLKFLRINFSKQPNT